MTSRDYVKAAIEHREADRVPYFIRFCGDAWEGMKELAGDTSARDFIDDDVLGFGPPWWGWHLLESDWRGMAAPTSRARVKGAGSYSDFEDAVKTAREKTDKYILVMIYGSHFEKANSARGIENFLADMAGEKEFARKLLTTIIDKNMVMLDNILSIPEIDGVLLGSDWGSQRGLLMSPAVWDEMIRPGEQREYDLVHEYGKDVWVHSCGDVEVLIPSLIEMGLDVLNPVQPECMGIVKLKENYGDKLTFWGGISTQRTLPYGTPDEVKEEARRVRDIMSTNGGYIFSPSQDIQRDVPVENIMALLEVAREKVR
ncbi:uroporphyrinogen decarboxylase family protein [Candidatus Poribacteria bacterium]